MPTKWTPLTGSLAPHRPAGAHGTKQLSSGSLRGATGENAGLRAGAARGAVSLPLTHRTWRTFLADRKRGSHPTARLRACRLLGSLL